MKSTKYQEVDILTKEVSNLFPQMNELELKIISLYSILELFGYWSDKPKIKNKEYSKIMDADHIYYSTACNIFLTRDNKLGKRALAIISYLKKKTRVYNIDGEEIKN